MVPSAGERYHDLPGHLPMSLKVSDYAAMKKSQPSPTVGGAPTDPKALLDRVRHRLYRGDRRVPLGIRLPHIHDERHLANWVQRLRGGTDQDVLKAVTVFGLPVLHPRVKANDPLATPDFAELQTLVWDRIASWCRLARNGEIDLDRDRGTALLRRLATALAGERRGRPGAARPMRTHFLRNRLLRRLEEARELLDMNPKNVSPDEWFEQVADASGVPPERLSETKGFSAAGSPTSLRDIASEWAAEILGREPGTVTNAVSKPRRSLRKQK